VCEDYLEVHIVPSFIYTYVYVFEVGEVVCGYWAGELGCKKASVPILVKCNQTQVINNITLLHIEKSDEKRRGNKLHPKREKWGLIQGGIKSKGIFY